MSVFCRIDDKHIPLYRVVWVSATPHYCGEEDCVREGSYEIRLEQGEVGRMEHELALRHVPVGERRGGLAPPNPRG